MSVSFDCRYWIGTCMPKGILFMPRINFRNDIVIIFRAASFSLVYVDHVGAQRQICTLELARGLVTWV